MTIEYLYPFSMEKKDPGCNPFAGYTIQFLMNWLKLSL